MRKHHSGVTLVELVVSIVIIGILASAFITFFMTQTTLFFYTPERIKTQMMAAELMDTMIEGDSVVSGIRFAGRRADGTGTIVHNATLPTNAFNLTYTYSGGDLAVHTITLSYDAGTSTVRRAIDGGALAVIPPYGSTLFKVTPAEVSFFRYYNAAGVEIVPPFTVAQLATIYRVDISFRANVAATMADFLVKSGTEIKRYTS